MILLLATKALFAHCDSLDGPVVQAAQRALATGDVNLVLPWVQPEQEPAIRQAFLRTMGVRTLSTAAETLADSWFFETLVRIHRAGEGAAYTGLKPGGQGVSDAVRAADKALATRDLKTLEKTLTAAMQQTLRERFSRAVELKGYQSADVSAGRRYVAAYVEYIHFAERLESAVARESDTGHTH